MSEAPRIALLATGGTISAVADARAGGGGTDAAGLAGLVSGANLCPLDVARVSSRAMTPELMRQLAVSIRAAIGDGCDGVVITHGTDTLEETAYALSLMLPRKAPVALTGAMRHPTEPGADGPSTFVLRSLPLRTRAVPRSVPWSCSATSCTSRAGSQRYIRLATAAFASPGLGPIGTVVEDRPELSLDSAPSDFLGFPENLEAQAVELHLNSLGVVSAGALAPLKAWLRLQVALALERSVRDAFHRPPGPVSL